MNRSSVLRYLHRIKVSDIPTIRKNGIDDWAFITYVCIIDNLESGAFLTLLGDRERDSFMEWLERHLDVTIESRVRSADYSQPLLPQRDNIEVADRFHLVKNLSEKISKLVNEKYADYKRLVRLWTTNDKKQSHLLGRSAERAIGGLDFESGARRNGGRRTNSVTIEAGDAETALQDVAWLSHLDGLFHEAETVLFAR